MATQKYTVLRRHYGDKMYEPGDDREANVADVRHLVDSGVLEPVREKAVTEPEAKAEGPAPQNKAVGRAPSNKKA